MKKQYILLKGQPGIDAGVIFTHDGADSYGYVPHEIDKPSWWYHEQFVESRPDLFKEYKPQVRITEDAFKGANTYTLVSPQSIPADILPGLEKVVEHYINEGYWMTGGVEPGDKRKIVDLEFELQKLRAYVASNEFKNVTLSDLSDLSILEKMGDRDGAEFQRLAMKYIKFKNMKDEAHS